MVCVGFRMFWEVSCLCATIYGHFKKIKVSCEYSPHAQRVTLESFVRLGFAQSDCLPFWEIYIHRGLVDSCRFYHGVARL
jgi:hypothetical protein